MKTEHYDVIIIGAGISGIGAACHLKMKCKNKSVAILERRSTMGGTWDLFKYPGIRSDSDMNTFGYSFRPWQETRTLADGPSIKSYIIDTAKEFQVDEKIKFNQKVVSASWSTKDSNWTIHCVDEKSNNTTTYTANFIINGSGYYDYDQGYRPDFKGEENYKGIIVHPQHWPKDLDYSGKKVVVIGSGATAVTLIPAMADKTSHITMLQRSPTYVATVPAIDPISEGMLKFLPKSLVFSLARTRFILMQKIVYFLARENPKQFRKFLLSNVKKQLGDAVDMKHFTPNYNPWEQRLCAVPDGDLFKVIKTGQASVVTDTIDHFTEKGIKLASGQEIEADIIITATGLKLQIMGGVEVSVDGKPMSVSDTMVYKGVLAEGLPNSAIIVGYVNASWTLKVDIACEYICRLINLMDSRGYKKMVPVDHENCKTSDTVMGTISAGYIKRAQKNLPKQGSKGYWRVSQDYLSDIPVLRYAPIEDKVLSFS